MSNNSHYVEHKSSDCESDEDEGSSNSSWELGVEKGEQKSRKEKLNIKIENNIFVCNTCKQSYRNSSGLEKHQKKHVFPGGYICKLCNATFITAADRLNHKEQLHKCYKCQICDDKFYTDREYIDHILEVHNGKDKEYVVCADCGQQFKTQSQLKIHNETMCGTQKLFSCATCNSRFTSQNTLNVHKLTHGGEKKHLCNFCGNRFLSKGQLKVHERSHTNDKPFKCGLCEKAFAYRESLVTHSTVHTGIKPYFCESCASRFSCIGNLIKHRKARPDSCGLPQFAKNSKIAPRASIKNRGSLTMKIAHTKNKSDTTTEIVTVKTDNEDHFNDDNISSFSPNMEMTESTHPPSEVTFIINEVPTVPKIENTYGNFTESFNTDGIYGTYQIYETPVTSYQTFENSETYQSFTGTTVESMHHNDAEQIIQFEVLESHHNNHDEFLDDNHNDDDDDVPLSELKTVVQKTKKHRLAKKKPRRKKKSRKNSSEEDSDEAMMMPTGDEVLKLKKEVEQYAKILADDCYECNICPKQYTKMPYMVKHLRLVHDVKIEMELESRRERRYSRKSQAEFRCNLCPKIYSTPSMLKKHKILHGPDGTLIHKCVCCPTFFATLDEVEKHQNEQHQDRLVCAQCKKVFKDPDSLLAHNRYSHKGIQPPKKKYSFICGKCGKNFTSKVALSDHERSNCGEKPIYKCEDCGKHYHSAGSLKTHQTLHVGVMPHLCKYCGKAFRTVGQVKVHERSHNGIKPYKCDYCPKTFAHRESLLTHHSLHTGFKRFMCSACGTRFSCISNLQAHRRSHKNTCGLQPNITKSIGPMGFGEVSNVAKMTPKKEF